MKNILILLSFLFLASCSFKNKEGINIIEETIDQLSKMQTVEYTLIIRNNDKTENTELTDTAFFFFDFTSNDTLIGAKYHYRTPTSEQAFDGKMYYSCEFDEHRIVYDTQPSVKILVNKMFLQGSYLQLKKILPKIISEPNTKITVKDSIMINNIACYQIDINVKEKDLVRFSNFVPSEEKNNSNFTLTVDKTSYLPIQFTWYYTKNNDLTSYFENIITPASMNNINFSLDKLPANYSRMTFKEFAEESQLKKDTIQIGQLAPDWVLPSIYGDSVRLKRLRGKIVLLEFMFQYCKACIKATPVINKIYSEYKNKGLEVYAIDIMKKYKDGYDKYLKKENITYPILYNGKELSAKYGIETAPTFFLIDKNGKVKTFFAGYSENLEKHIINQINEMQ